MVFPLLRKVAEEIEKKEVGGDEENSKKDESAPAGEEEPATEEEKEPPAEMAGEQVAAGPVDPMVVMGFFASNSNITDDQFHSFAEQSGFNIHEAESIAYQLASAFMEMIRGGKGYNIDMNSVDPQQLEMGLAIEAEHTSNPSLQKK